MSADPTGRAGWAATAALEMAPPIFLPTHNLRDTNKKKEASAARLLLFSASDRIGL